MPVPAKQLTFSNISTDFDKFYNQNQDNLLSLLDEFINISDFIPFSFYQNYYSKWIDSAKTIETKSKRIAQCLFAFANNMDYGEMLRHFRDQKL